jgi:hypothetical protein
VLLDDGDRVPHVEGKGFLVTARAPEVGLVAPPVLDVAIDLPPSRIPMRVTFTANGARTRTTLLAG